MKQEVQKFQFPYFNPFSCNLHQSIPVKHNTKHNQKSVLNLFIHLGFYVTFNTVQVISRWMVGRAEETSTYSLSGFCTVNCQPMASNYLLSHLRPCREPNPGLRGGRREFYHSTTVAPLRVYLNVHFNSLKSDDTTGKGHLYVETRVKHAEQSVVGHYSKVISTQLYA